MILGKTNLSEWANFRSTHSSSGWSGRGGQTKNPYALDRNPCGSSSGTGAAISASLAAVGVGTETDGSVVCPSSVVRHRRHQTHRRPHQPRRHRSDCSQSRHSRSDGAHRLGRGAASRHSHGRRPARPRDAGERYKSLPRLHALLRSDRSARRTSRHSASIFQHQPRGHRCSWKNASPHETSGRCHCRSGQLLYQRRLARH